MCMDPPPPTREHPPLPIQAPLVCTLEAHLACPNLRALGQPSLWGGTALGAVQGTLYSPLWSLPLRVDAARAWAPCGEAAES